MDESSESRILHLLKTRGPQTASALAGWLGMTSVGARQHLTRLGEEGLVTHEDQAGSIGRPKRYWHLTDTGHQRFPDAHSHLTLELLDSVRSIFGDEGLDRLIDHRETQSLAVYASELRDCADPESRVRRLAEIRTREGYMAEYEATDDGGFVLVENHCPICAAARECQGLCRSELDIFRAVLGERLEVERTDHVLAGARRCAYRITPAKP